MVRALKRNQPLSSAVAAPAPCEPDDAIDVEFYSVLIDLAVRAYVALPVGPVIRSDINPFEAFLELIGV